MKILPQKEIVIIMCSVINTEIAVRILLNHIFAAVLSDICLAQYVFCFCWLFISLKSWFSIVANGFRIENRNIFCFAIQFQYCCVSNGFLCFTHIQVFVFVIFCDEKHVKIIFYMLLLSIQKKRNYFQSFSLIHDTNALDLCFLKYVLVINYNSLP